MTQIENVRQIFEDAGIKADRFGNYIINGSARTLRFKLQEKSFRVEVKIEATKMWKSCMDGKVMYYSKYMDKLPIIIQKAIALSNK